MKPNPKNRATERPKFLNGWKDIAGYLGKGVRTVQRYEREFGLPVRRPAGKTRGSVVATQAELDGWVSASPIRETYELPVRSQATAISPLQQVRNSVDEMKRLREQMTALRAEVRASVQLVRASIREVEQQTTRNLAMSIPVGVSPWDGNRHRLMESALHRNPIREKLS